MKKLKDQTVFTYYEIYHQDLDLNSTIINKLIDENIRVIDNRVECLQIGENVIDDFMITIETGRPFEARDFSYNEASDVPIILGNTYNGVWDIGTRFEGEYLYNTYSFVVIGILDANKTSGVIKPINDNI